MKENILGRKEDILNYWRINKQRFPKMAQLIFKFLCIAPSSAESERMFSTAGDFLTKKRTTMKSDKLNKLVFLKKNKMII